MLTYWAVSKHFYNSDWMSQNDLDLFLYDFFLFNLNRTLFFTRQLLFLNDFIDLSQRRNKDAAYFASLSTKRQLELYRSAASLDLSKNASSFSGHSKLWKLSKIL